MNLFKEILYAFIKGKCLDYVETFDVKGDMDYIKKRIPKKMYNGVDGLGKQEQFQIVMNAPVWYKIDYILYRHGKMSMEFKINPLDEKKIVKCTLSVHENMGHATFYHKKYKEHLLKKLEK